MSPSTDSLLYTAQLPYPHLTRYQFVVLNSTDHIIDSEPFYRTAHDTTHYAFYGRAITQQAPTVHLSQVRYQSSGHNYTKQAISRHRLHPRDEIPTFHIHMHPKDVDTMYHQIMEEPVFHANLTRITSDRIEQYSDLEFSLGGQTSKLFDKLTFSIQFNKKQSMDGFRKFKIRSCATDPSYLREKIYYDMMEAANMPSSKASFIRLFINGEPQGLYLMVDHLKSPFLNNIFGGGNKHYREGALIQGQMQENPMAKGILKLGASLNYLGSSSTDYIEPSLNTSAYRVVSKPKAKGLEAFVSFINFIHQHPTSPSFKAWQKTLDVSLFLKHMALELLLGHTDGYIGAAHNYMLYQDPGQQGRWVWFSTDLDQTMGNTLKPPSGLLDRFGLWKMAPQRPLIQQLFRSQAVEDEFLSILTDFHRQLLNPTVLFPYIDAMQRLIAQDVVWDQSLDRINYLKRHQPQVYQHELEQRVLQLPLGQDFIDRIEGRLVDFETAIKGKVEGHLSIVSLYDWFRETHSLFNPRIIAQIVVSLGSVVTRAFVAAYKQAAANAAKNGGAANTSGGGRTGTKEAVMDALTRKTGMSMEEACQILNVTKEADLSKIAKSYEHLFGVNDPSKGGSFYLQSKVVRAKERFDMERAEELKAKAAQEAATAAAKEANGTSPPPPPPNNAS
ncbi:coth protein-domain-containing protein [Choanephora cucurbitarum]|nr:coth protein-domain-containing protein [Choanephora cucurbitarum]